MAETSLSCLELRALQFKPVKCRIVVDKEEDEGLGGRVYGLKANSAPNLYACVITENLNAWLSCKLEFKNAITQQFRTPPVHLSLHERTRNQPAPVCMCDCFY